MISFALDSLEVTFIKMHLEQSEQLYGLIISVAGRWRINRCSGFNSLCKAPLTATVCMSWDGLNSRCNGYRLLYFDRGDYMVLIRYAHETDLAAKASLMSELGCETTESDN